MCLAVFISQIGERIMSKMYLFLCLLPIAYGITLMVEYLCDKLLQSKEAILAEWDCKYSPPICSRNILLALFYVSLCAACYFSSTLKGQIISSLLLIQLVVVCVIDYKYQFIFDEQNILLAVTGLVRIMDYPTIWKEPLAAAVGAFVVMFILAIVSRGAMGGGDVKLMAALGVWLGVWGIMNAFFYGVIAGGVGALALLIFSKKGRKDFFAFGPYLCLGAIYAWYLQAFNW